MDGIPHSIQAMAADTHTEINIAGLQISFSHGARILRHGLIKGYLFLQEISEEQHKKISK